MKTRKKFVSLLLALLMVIGLLPITSIPVYAWDNSCTYCGEGRSDDYLCSSCGGCGGEIEGSTCWLENHCPECGNCHSDVDFCQDCWRCDECYRICPNCEKCYDCGANGFDEYCSDCEQCVGCIPGQLCSECSRCEACVDFCGEPGHNHCIECVEYCPECYRCSDSWTVEEKCESCGRCVDCFPFPWCDQCECCADCTGDSCLKCERCSDCIGDLCTNCSACEGCLGSPLCPSCGECSECCNEPQCQDCSQCANCVIICDDCYEHCNECVDMCQECYTGSCCTDLCESCHEYCNGCREFCGNCSYCEECVEICLECSDYCSECSTLCPESGVCHDCNDHYCEICDRCSDCVTVCSRCNQICIECADLCPNCDTCEYCTTLCSINEDHCHECLSEDAFCSGCGACENCATICPGCGEVCSECGYFCEYCGLCDDCPQHDYCERCDDCYSAPHHMICAVCGDHGVDLYFDIIDETYHGQRCVCGGIQKDIEAHGFNYSVITEPTETEAGIGQYKCNDCGYVSSEQVIIPATGGEAHTHLYDMWRKFSTYHYPFCACGADLSNQIELHTFEWVIDQQPTTTTSGLKHEECTVCDYKKAPVSIPALGHTCSFSDQWSKDASNHWHGCSCGAKANQAAHSYGAWVITNEPTATLAGSKERPCTVCQYKQIVGIPATAEYLTVTFDCQGGSSVADVSVKNGSQVTNPEDPILTGYVFGGWSTTASGEIPWNFNHPVTQATTLYAKWLEPPAITTASLTGGVVNKTYTQTLTASGSAPVKWTLDSGTLPDGLTMTEDGIISGSPTKSGTFTFTVKATNAAGNPTQSFTIEIANPIRSNNGGTDPQEEPLVEETVSFEDVKASDWFYDNVKYICDNKLMVGTATTLFSPNLETSRAMIVTILYRLEKEPAVTGAPTFTDIAAGSYYEKAVTWAATNGIASGYSTESFGPDDAITREQMAAILMNYAQHKGYDVSTRADLSKFADGESISPWAKDAMSWANANKLINGKGNGILDPKGNARRCEVAAIVHRFIMKFVG